MKLDADNPEAMKRKALRVNPEATLQSFTNTTGNKAHAKERTGFVPTIKDPNAVLAPSISVWKQPVYVSPKNEYVRPGAYDYLKIKSRGCDVHNA